ncbi:hypothetical protein [Halobacillus andaensis]|uniref:hypothetical protein n=1 Tax=Halobacillus andaensis TaxID=1176239 RepID=UPI0016665525|nr:hypothetical protein [Halobacillus andaensis]MBP2004772.1 hypothetical protein [Halobacillus andaensis]
MFRKIEAIAIALIFIGFLLWVSSSRFSFVPFSILAAIGLTLLVIARSRTQRHGSFLCRIGFHKNKHIGWDDEMKSVAIYQCERCGRTKKVMKTV